MGAVKGERRNLTLRQPEALQRFTHHGVGSPHQDVSPLWRGRGENTGRG